MFLPQLDMKFMFEASGVYMKFFGERAAYGTVESWVGSKTRGISHPMYSKDVKHHMSPLGRARSPKVYSQQP